jgi:transposase
MFALTGSDRYLLYGAPTDMRKSFDGLCGLVEQGLRRSPTSGEVFVFLNRRRDKVKLLKWEKGGFVLFYKRLEAGTFEPPVMGDEGKVLHWPSLVMMIEGVSPSKIGYRKRFDPQRDVEKK